MLTRPHRYSLDLMVLVVGLLLGPSTAMSEQLKGVGELNFGMTPDTVQALSSCSSSEECLYELLGKNRYFTLSYDRPNLSEEKPRENQLPTGRLLRSIDVDMGNYTAEWFMELYEVLKSQYSLVHIPTDQEDTLFQQGQDSELIIGFADGHVLLKVVRRTFGNLILRIIFQDTTWATHTRKTWASLP